jgi:hypothetical protein
MKNLDELYKIREMLHANGMEMSSEQLKGLNEAEEDYIRKELTTAIKKAVGSALEKIQRPFDIVVHHRPNKKLELDIIQSGKHKSVEDGVPLPHAAEADSEPTIDNAEDNPKANAVRKARRKSVGFSVAFPDGTVYHESQAVETFILALKKIGLERIASDPGVPQHVGYSVVSEYERKADKTVQRQVDGYYIYTNLGNDVKIDDLQDLSKRYNLGLTITLDEDSENGEVQSVVERHLPTIDWESYRYNLPVKEQFYHFLHERKAEGTAKSYVSTLDNAVRKWVNQEVNERADSVFGYTTIEDVKLCIDMLNASPDFVAENDRKHHSMSAALSQYLLFVEDMEARYGKKNDEQ